MLSYISKNIIPITSSLLFSANAYAWFRIIKKEDYKIDMLKLSMLSANVCWWYFWNKNYNIIQSLKIANKYMEEQKYDEAEKILLKYTEYKNVACNLGNIYHAQQKYNDALHLNI